MDFNKLSSLSNEEFETLLTNEYLSSNNKRQPSNINPNSMFNVEIPKPKPEISLPKEMVKSVGRAALDTTKLGLRTAQTASNIAGASLGVMPDKNMVSRGLGNAAEWTTPKEGDLTFRNPEMEKEHPILSTIQDVGEGAAPWLISGALTGGTGGALGPLILPAVAGLSHSAESTDRQIKRGVSGGEALLRSAPGAAATAISFYTMPKVLSKFKGSVNPVTGAVTKGILGTPTKGVLRNAGQGLITDAPYLLAQGELSQGVDVAAGAMTPDEWKESHTPEAIRKNLLQTAVTGAGFGALHSLSIPKEKEVIDDKTPTDILKVVEPFGPTSDTWTQPSLDLGKIKTRDTTNSILPNGEGVFNFTKVKDIEKKLKKIGVQPVVEDLGIDVLGNRKARIFIPQEEQGTPMSSLDHQYSFDFQGDVNKNIPLKQSEFDLTGVANAPLKPLTQRVNNADTRNRLSKMGLEGGHNLQGSIEMPTHYTAEGKLEYTPEEQLEFNFNPKETINTKSEGKIEPLKKEVIPTSEVAVEQPNLTQEPLEIKKGSRTRGKKNNTVLDPMEQIKDFMTNPESKVKAEDLTHLGQSVEDLNKSREYNLNKAKEALSIENTPVDNTLIETTPIKVESTEAVPTEIPLKPTMRKKVSKANEEANFDDSISPALLERANSILKEKQTNEIKRLTKQHLRIQKQTPPEGMKELLRAQRLEREELSAKHAKEGTTIDLKTLREKLQKEVGSADIKEELEYQKKKEREGWKDTELARELAFEAHENGGITHKMIETLLADNLIRAKEDVPKTKGKVRADRIEHYKDQALGVLNKAVEDGILVRQKDAYIKVKGKNIQRWYKENIKDKSGLSADNLKTSRKPTENIGLPDTDVKLTKAELNAKVVPEAEVIKKQRTPEEQAIINEKLAEYKRINAYEDKRDYSESGIYSSGNTIENVKRDLGKDAPNVDVYQSIKDLPAAVKEQMREDNVSNVEGFYDRATGKITLIADGIDNVKGAVQRVFTHEITHHGIQTLGIKGKQLLNQIYVAHKAEIDAMVSSKKDKLDRTNEFIARFGEENLKPTLLKKLINFLKDVWSKATGKVPTDKDLRDMMKEVRNSLNAKEKTPESGIDYSEGAFKTEKYVISEMGKLFNPKANKNIVEGFTNLFGDYLNEKGLVKTAWKGLFRNPYFVEHLREATTNMGKSIEVKNRIRNFLLGEENIGLNDMKALALKDIAEEYNKLSKEDLKGVHEITTLGDKLEKEFNTIEEARKELNISEASFNSYQKYTAFVRQAMNKLSFDFAKTLSHTITESPEMRIAIREAIMNPNINTKAEFMNFFENHRNIKNTKISEYVNDAELRAILKQLTEAGGIKDAYKDYSMNYGTKRIKGYMPRVRLEGGEWVVTLDKTNINGDKVPVFNQTFYNKIEADVVARDLKENPEKYIPHNFKGLSEGDTLNLDGIQTRRLNNTERYGYAADKSIAETVGKALDEAGVGSVNRDAIIKNIRQEIINKTLAQHGRKHIIKRKETLIEGYDENSPFEAIETMLNNQASSFAKMRYLADQTRLLEKADPNKKAEIKEYINMSLKPSNFGAKHAQALKNITAVYFMGFRPLTALMQMAQLHTVGAAELGMHLKEAGIKTPAQILLAKAGKDVVKKNLTKAEKFALDEADSMGITFSNSSMASLFSGADDQTVRTRLGKRFTEFADKSMYMMKLAETYNRRAAILASYRVFSKGSKEFSREAFDKAVEYNNNTNFMLNKGNVPYWMMNNPIGMSMYNLMSYSLNMSNWLLNRAHGSLSDKSIDKKTQREAFFKMLGYTAVLAGASGLPFADDLNKIIRKMTGKDLKRDTEQFIKKNAGEDIADLLSYGALAPAGLNITNNIGLRIPFVSGLIDNKTAAESAFGASGAMVGRGATAIKAAANGEGRKFTEAVMPEFVSSALRAERMYDKGQRDATGKPVLYQGKPFKSTGVEALLQGTMGLKSQRRAKMMETLDSEFKLKEFWSNERKVAERKAASGDKDAIRKFNKALLKNDAKLLVKPILGGVKAPKVQLGKVAFEND